MQITKDVDGRKATGDDADASCDQSTCQERDMRKELEQWRQAKSAKQGRTKDCGWHRPVSEATPLPAKTAWGNLPQSCDEQKMARIAPERDMRKELDEWKQARAARHSHGKENPSSQSYLASIPATARSAVAPLAEVRRDRSPLPCKPREARRTFRRQENPVLFRDKGCFRSHNVGRAAANPSDSAHGGKAAAAAQPEGATLDEEGSGCASERYHKEAKNMQDQGAESAASAVEQDEEEIIHEGLRRRHVELLDRLAALQEEAIQMQRQECDDGSIIEEALQERFRQVSLELQELTARQQSQEFTAWRRRVRRHVISWPTQTALDMEDHLSRSHDLFNFWFFEMRDRLKTALPGFKPDKLRAIPEDPP
mmetsp:Transcript_24123/g.45560  ORF Transcript_24123/g.45560 Transcript_24123/m.45560 type:complete len:368 (-) Transcript_24123:96-1199(-)